MRDDLLHEALTRGQVVRLRAVSGSMFPTIRIGDLILVRRENFEIGDIVLIRDNNDWIAHRLIALNNNQAVLRGDAEGATAHEVYREQLVGRVIAIQRDLRSVLLLFRRRFFLGCRP